MGTERVVTGKAIVRGYTETRHRAKSWNRERRAVARIEATTLGLDIRFVVTNLAFGSAEWLYDSLYCARGQAENLIKLHKTQLASDRTSCRSASANQMRLVLHTAAYWLMLAVRDAIPKPRELATAEFATLRIRLLKIAARIIETTSRVHVAFAAHVLKLTCSDHCPARSGLRAPDRRGNRPVRPRRFSNAFSSVQSKTETLSAEARLDRRTKTVGNHYE